MLDRTVAILPVREPPVYVEKTIIHKHAPTDESVKLLREMEAKAEAEVVKAIAVHDNAFNCVVHEMKDLMADAIRFRAVWSLNGAKHTTDCFVPAYDIDKTAAMVALRDEIAKDIASFALCALPRTLMSFN